MYQVKSRQPTTVTFSSKIYSKSLPEGMNRVPPNIFKLIFSFLEMEDLCSLRRVCSLFKRIATDDELWKNIFLQHFQISAQNQEEEEEEEEENEEEKPQKKEKIEIQINNK